jgi:hypothetical protein
VTEGFDPGALLARSYVLPRGPRTCLRLARPRDAGGIADLFWQHGLEPDEFEIARLVRFDPRRRIVICATALINAAETVIGVGAIDLDSGGTGLPHLVLVDEHLTEGLEHLIGDALLGRAAVLTRGRAA